MAVLLDTLQLWAVGSPHHAGNATRTLSLLTLSACRRPDPELCLQACKVLLQEGLLDSIQATKAAATEKFVGALDHKYQRSTS